MRTKIYSLSEESGEIRYIGKTVKSLSSRLCQHLCIARKKTHSHHRDNWLRSLLSKGILPSIALLEEVNGNGCAEEIRWISIFRSSGADLVNTTEGGEGVTGLRHSKETKDRWSKLRRGISTGRPIHPNAKAALLAANLGSIRSEETRSKISAALKGRKLPASTIEKIRASMIGRLFTPEWRAKISAANKGRSFSEETKRKMSESAKRKKLSPEHRAKIGAAMKKRKLSEQHKLNISAAHKRRKCVSREFPIPPSILVGPK